MVLLASFQNGIKAGSLSIVDGTIERNLKHSIILTSFNRPTFVRQAIRSVLDQTRSKFELLVADDGSTEETITAIKEAIGDDSRAKLIEFAPPKAGEQRQGVHRMVSNINACLKLATGDLVHYLADDDYYDTRRLERFNKLFMDDQVRVGYGVLVYVDNGGRLTGEVRYRDRIDDPLCVLDHNQLAHRRELIEECGLWANSDEGKGRFAPDGYFFRKLRKKHEFHGTPFIVAYKREHTRSMTLSKDAAGAKRE